MGRKETRLHGVASPEGQRGHWSPGASAWEPMGVRVTLDLDSGLGVTQGPDVHHHVHAPGGKVLVVW